MFHNESGVLAMPIVGDGMFSERFRSGAPRVSSRSWRNRTCSEVTIAVFAEQGGLRE